MILFFEGGATIINKAIDENQLIQRTFLIINIPEPAGLYIHGIREWVKNKLVGIPVEGSVKRSVFDGLQSVTVKVTGTSATLDHIYELLHSDNWTIADLEKDKLVKSFVHCKI